MTINLSCKCHNFSRNEIDRTFHTFKYYDEYIQASFRFLGACNTTTDIKEANFLGSHGQFIMAGSDDGKFFIWDRRSGNIVRVLVGDESIVNCLQVRIEQKGIDLISGDAPTRYRNTEYKWESFISRVTPTPHYWPLLA